jgi:hypothetical protein
MMYQRNIFSYIAVLSLTFISVGDRFLPHPYGQISTNTREKINQFAIGLFPQVQISSNSRRVWQEGEREYSGNGSNN